MKTAINTMLALCAALIMAGCATNGQSKQLTPAQAQALAAGATEVGVLVTLRQKPDALPQLKASAAAVQHLVDTERWDADALKEALKASGAKVFQSADARLTMAFVVNVVNVVTGASADASTLPYAKAVTLGINQGFKAALEP